MNSYLNEREEWEDQPIDLLRILNDMWQGFQRFWPLFPLIILLCGGLMYFRAKSGYVPYYASSATFTVSNVSDDIYDTSVYYNNMTAAQMEKTFPYILSSSLLMKMVAQDLGVTAIPGTISADSISGTNLFTITVTARDAQSAYDVLESVIKNYPTVAEYVIGKTEMELLDMTGVVETPVNTPAFVRSGMKGAALGVVLCTLLVLLFAITRRTVRSTSDLKKLLNIDCISTVPQVYVKKRRHTSDAKITIYNRKISQAFIESIRVLRIRIEKEARKDDHKIILITSAVSGEGKSTVAVNTALALGMNGYKVALVDCDLRGPSVLSTLGIEEKMTGLSDYLVGEKNMAEVLHYIPEMKLYLIPGGTCCRKCYDKIDSPQVESLLKELRNVVDYIVLDTAPAGMFADTSLLADQVDMALFVVRQDYARAEEILDGISQMTDSGVHVAGCILNGVQGGFGSYKTTGYNSGKYGYSRYHSTKDMEE